MDLRAVLGAFAILAVALSGCGSKAAPADDGGPPAEEHGAIEGTVVDDEQQPVAGALIAIKTIRVSPVALKSRAGEDGAFKLENIPPGRQTVLVAKEGYNEASTSVTVVPGETTKVHITLTSKPVNLYTKTTLNPIIGHYDCALEAVATTGECDFEIRNHTGQSAFQTKNNASFTVPPDWGGLLFEITWSAASETSTIEGIRLLLESQEEPGGYFVRSTAQASPARVAVTAKQVVAGASLGYPIPQRGIAAWIKVLPMGTMEGATCAAQCGSGVGGALNLEYEIHPTIFFGGPVDPEFSALPKT